MKKVVLSVAAFVIATASIAQKTVADVAKFTTETVDLGKVKQGNPTTATFNVTNIGKEPLIIEQANPTCGCTISDYTKVPIAAGKAGVITATYNAAGAGHFEKHLTVKFAGVDEIKSITLTGDVLAAEDFDKWKLENDAKAKTDNASAVATPTTVTKSKMKVKKPKATPTPVATAPRS